MYFKYNLSYFVRYENINIIHKIDYLNLIVPSVTFVIILIIFKFYKNITRFLNISFNEFYKIFILYLLIYSMLVFYFLTPLNIFFNQRMELGSSIPKSTILTVPIFLYILFVSSRYIIKIIIFHIS